MQFKSISYYCLLLLLLSSLPLLNCFASISSSKKILLAFDGTGNNAKDFQPNPETDKSFTNVLKIHLLAGGDINGKVRTKNDNIIPGQISIHESGIGTVSDKALIRTLRQIGGDLSRQTIPMRKKLESIYEEGDKLYIIGFSRGAAAARKFAMELYNDGLMISSSNNDDEKTTTTTKIIKEPPIEFLGCFETVSMQLKRNLLGAVWSKLTRQIPKSTVLGEKGVIAPNIKLAVHNVALDDNRMYDAFPRFPPVLMSSDDGRVYETWFAGEHGDVGGSYYTKGIPDCSCHYMMEWIESLDDSLTFLKAGVDDINPECLTIDGYPNIQISPSDLTVLPDPSDKLHLTDKVHKSILCYRPVICTQGDVELKDATVKVHVSVLHHMEAMNEKGTPYKINPELKQVKVVIVGSLGQELETETNRFIELIGEQ